MKKRISWNTTNKAYFVKGPEISSKDFVLAVTDNEVSRKEAPNIAERRLKYKIDRGEYNYADATFARKVWYLLNDKDSAVPLEICQRWYEEILIVFEEKTEREFFEKFKLRDVFWSLSKEEKARCFKDLKDYLENDLKKRAQADPLKELPTFLSKQIEEYKIEKNAAAPFGDSVKRIGELVV